MITALGKRLSGNKNGCYPEAGSGAAPERKQRNTARIPDAMIRCHDLPRLTFEIISPSELKDWCARDQSQFAVHIYRKGGDGTWTFHPVGGPDAAVDLSGAGEPMSIPLVEIYEFAMPADDAADDQTE